MGYPRNIEINGMELYRLMIEKTNANNITSACSKLGFATSTIGDAYSTNKISRKTVDKLERHGIYLCDYISDPNNIDRVKDEINEMNTEKTKSYPIGIKRKSATVLIDKDKFRTLLFEAAGTNVMTDISTKLGYNYQYIGQVSNRGDIPKSMVLLLENVYGMKYDDYKYEEPETEEVIDTEEEIDIPEETTDLVSEIKGLKEEMSLMKDLIFKLGQVNMDVLNEIKGLREDWRS